MPHYTFVCPQCKAEDVVHILLAEYDAKEGMVQCIKCGAKMDRAYSGYFPNVIIKNSPSLWNSRPLAERVSHPQFNHSTGTVIESTADVPESARLSTKAERDENADRINEHKKAQVGINEINEYKKHHIEGAA